jgi:hypothetical protein
MANVIQADYPAGFTLYAQAWNMDGQVWNGAAFVSYATANIADYDLLMTELGTASGHYTVAVPALPAGQYAIVVKVRAGGSPAEADVTVGTENGDWDGTVWLPLSTVHTQTTTILAAVDTEVAAILAKVNKLPEGISKNTALSNFEFYMVQSADHISAATGLTITAERSIDGGAFTAMSNSASEVSAGVYKINLAAADTNGDFITYKFTATGADASVVSFKTEEV